MKRIQESETIANEDQLEPKPDRHNSRLQKEESYSSFAGETDTETVTENQTTPTQTERTITTTTVARTSNHSLGQSTNMNMTISVSTSIDSPGAARATRSIMTLDPAMLRQLSVGDMPNDESDRKSVICCGCCCDVLRACIIVNILNFVYIIFMFFFAWWGIALWGNLEMTNNNGNADDDDDTTTNNNVLYMDDGDVNYQNYDDDDDFYMMEQAQQKEKSLWITKLSIVVQLCGILFTTLGIIGAAKFNKCLVLVCGIWYMIDGMVAGYYLVWPSLFLKAFFAYPHIALYMALKSGSIAPHRYMIERHCCCDAKERPVV